MNPSWAVLRWGVPALRQFLCSGSPGKSRRGCLLPERDRRSAARPGAWGRKALAGRPGTCAMRAGVIVILTSSLAREIAHFCAVSGHFFVKFFRAGTARRVFFRFLPCMPIGAMPMSIHGGFADSLRVRPYSVRLSAIPDTLLAVCLHRQQSPDLRLAPSSGPSGRTGTPHLQMEVIHASHSA